MARFLVFLDHFTHDGVRDDDVLSTVSWGDLGWLRGPTSDHPSRQPHSRYDDRLAACEGATNYQLHGILPSTPISILLRTYSALSSSSKTPEDGVETPLRCIHSPSSLTVEPSQPHQAARVPHASRPHTYAEHQCQPYPSYPAQGQVQITSRLILKSRPIRMYQNHAADSLEKKGKIHGILSTHTRIHSCF